jgi:hypothetical protein
MPIFQGDIETGPAQYVVPVVPSDSANFSFGMARALYVGVAGNITLDTANSTNVLFTAVPVGILPVAAVRVRATGTAATGILALY